MRHLLIAASLLLVSLLLVQVVAVAFQDSATRGHEVSDNFVPGELPRSALPAMLGPGLRTRAAGSEQRTRPEPRPARSLDDRHPPAPQPLDIEPQQPAVKETVPPSQTPGSLKLPAPPIQNVAPPGADRV